MRWSDVPDFPWPPKPLDFKKIMQDGFQRLDEIARVCLSTLAEGMKKSTEYFTSVLDDQPFPSGHFSNSILTIYKYFSSEKQTESCEIHKTWES